MTFEESMSERIAAVNAAVGYEPTEDEQEWIDDYSDKLAETAFHNPSQRPINGSDVGKALAIEAIDSWNRNRHIRPESYNPIGRQPIWRPEPPSSRVQPDMSDPSTMFKLLCIVAHKPNKAHSLDKFSDWTSVALGNYYGCDARISANCTRISLTSIPLSRGEFVTLHKFCNHCLRWFHAHSAELVEANRNALNGFYDIEPTNAVRLAELKSINVEVWVKPSLRLIR